MTICMFCGTKLMDGAKFCYKCERKLEYPDEQQPKPSPSKHDVDIARIKAEQDTESGRELHDMAMLHGVGGDVAKKEAKYRNIRSLDESAKVSVFTGNQGGSKKRYCSYCDMEISRENRPLKCMKCGSRFCEHCEGWFRSTERKRGDLPLCKEHYLEEKTRIEKERREREEQERKEREQREAERKRLEEERKRAEMTEVPEGITNSIGMKFKKIPGKDYYMGKYTVTQKEWKAVMGTTPWKGKNYVKVGDDYPATYISWNDCQKFVKKLNSKEGGNKYRLPTEAEWERACRAGSTTEYYYGDDEGRLGEYAWYYENADSIGEEYAHRVGQKKPNKWGLYDMHGNVWEWCQDKWDEAGSYRVVRGGGWGSYADYCRSANRRRNDPGLGYYDIGLRLVREA